MALLDAGEPYDGDPPPQAILDEITAHHSVVLHRRQRSPRRRSSDGERLHRRPVPGRRGAALLQPHPDRGPRCDRLARSSASSPATRARPSKPTSTARCAQRELDWFDHFVKGTGPEPFTGVEAFTQTCPASAPVGRPLPRQDLGPHRAGRDPLRLERRRRRSSPARATRRRGEVRPGQRRRRLREGRRRRPARRRRPTGSTRRPPGGYTMLGSPTVIAEFTLPGDTSQVAARLLDVGPDGQETLIARGLWRPASGGSEQAGVPAAPERLALRRGPRRRSSSCCRPTPEAAR